MSRQQDVQIPHQKLKMNTQQTRLIVAAKQFATDTAKKFCRQFLASGDIHQEITIDVNIPQNATKDEIKIMMETIVKIVTYEIDCIAKIVLPKDFMDKYNEISWTIIQRYVSKYEVKLIIISMKREEQEGVIKMTKKIEGVIFHRCCVHCGRQETGKEENKMMKCGKCKAVYYCDVGCQKKDWASHKKICNKC